MEDLFREEILVVIWIVCEQLPYFKSGADLKLQLTR